VLREAVVDEPSPWVVEGHQRARAAGLAEPALLYYCIDDDPRACSLCDKLKDAELQRPRRAMRVLDAWGEVYWTERALLEDLLAEALDDPPVGPQPFVLPPLPPGLIWYVRWGEALTLTASVEVLSAGYTGLVPPGRFLDLNPSYCEIYEL
jgi:hypothetical protein